MSRFKNWWHEHKPNIPSDAELWPESQGAGYSPNESNGVLGGFTPWREGLVEPSDAPWDWPSF